MNQKFRKQLVEAFIALILGLIAVVAATFLIIVVRSNFEPKKETKQLERIETNTQEIKKIATPYEYKDSLNKVVIIKDFVNSTKNGAVTNYFDKQFAVSGPFNQGYLYIKVSVDNKALNPKDDVYAKLYTIIDGQYQEFGGHLILSKSLDTPRSLENTELLFELSDIKYKKDYQGKEVEVLSGDWLELMNAGSNQKIVGFTSTMGTGKIIELSIYYECVKGANCSIKLQ